MGERATLCPFSQFDGNAKARFRAFRGGWTEGEGAAGLVDGRGSHGERDLVYGTARLEINVHDIPSTILFNGGNVEKYFVHVGLWRFVFYFPSFFLIFRFLPFFFFRRFHEKTL